MAPNWRTLRSALPRSIRLVPFLAAMILICAPPLAHAVTVSVVPADTTVNLGDTFALRIVTTHFADLKGYQLIHEFGPAVIELQGIDPGDVLTASGRTHTCYALPDYAAPPDTAWLDAAMLQGSTSGPGILAFVRFRAKAVGVSPVDCRWADFRDSYNVQTLPDCASGVVHVEKPVPTLPVTWGRLKVLYR